MFKVDTIPLGICADMIESGDHKMLSRFPLPNRYLKKRFVLFQLKMMEFLFDTHETQFFMDEWRHLMFFHKARTVLPLLYQGIRYSDRKIFVDYFEKFYGKFPGREKALKRIELAIKQLDDKLKDMEKDSEAVEKFSLWSIIISVENLLGRNIDKRMRLDRFKIYMKKAAENGREDK